MGFFAGFAGPRVLSVGPRLLSNQTSQPISVIGERLVPGLSLHLGPPLNLSVPLIVLDERHAYARLPADLPVGKAPETLISATLVGGQGSAEFRVVGDSTFPELTASALSNDGAHLFVASGSEDRVYDVDLLHQAVTMLAVGDGPSALAAIRRTDGRCEDPTDPEVLAGIRLLAETEGLFAETAGGTVVAAAKRLAEAGTFADGRPVVLLITGHGLKTVEALGATTPFATVIDGKLDEFEAFWSEREATAVA